MNRRHAQRSIVKLFILIALAVVYAVLTYGPRTLTGSARQDGAVGVVLGLLICSQPAAYVVDLVYRSREQAADWPRWIWPVLNLLAFLAGVSVVVLGTIQLAQAAPVH